MKIIYGNKGFTLKITVDKVFGDEWILQYCNKSHSDRYKCLIKKRQISRTNKSIDFKSKWFYI